MAKEWRNWAGDQRCLPTRIEAPASRAELVDAVARAGEEGLTVRAAGHGHSFTDIACTGGVMLDLQGPGPRARRRRRTPAWSRSSPGSACAR